MLLDKSLDGPPVRLLHSQPMTVGDCIKAKRKARKLTLAQVAEAAGWHKTTVLRYETGALRPRTDDLEALARIFRCEVRALIPRKPRVA